MAYLTLTKSDVYGDDKRESGVSYREALKSMSGGIECTMGSCPVTMYMY